MRSTIFILFSILFSVNVLAQSKKVCKVRKNAWGQKVVRCHREYVKKTSYENSQNDTEYTVISTTHPVFTTNNTEKWKLLQEILRQDSTQYTANYLAGSEALTTPSLNWAIDVLVSENSELEDINESKIIQIVLQLLCVYEYNNHDIMKNSTISL